MPTNPVSPDFVPNFPILHLERIGVAVRRAHGALTGRCRTVRILTHAAASVGVAPRPSTFTVIDGSALTFRQRRTNSSVPKSLGSGSLPQERFVHVSR